MYLCITKNRGVEQLVARRAHNPKVVGSSPAAATKKGLLFSQQAFFHYGLWIKFLKRRIKEIFTGVCESLPWGCVKRPEAVIWLLAPPDNI